jgi:ABC-type multidrug transport system permease subunit
MECAIRFLPQIWRARVPLARKMTASLHLTAYATHFLTLGLILVFPLLLTLSISYPALLKPEGLGLFANLMFLVPTAYFAIGQHQLGQRLWRRLPLILSITVLASGLMLNTLSAALQILRRKTIPFERTPKYGILDRRQDWRNKRYRVRTDPLVLLELALAAFTLWTASFAWHTGHWLIMTYSFFFAAGLLFTSGFTLLQALSQNFVARHAG